MTGVPDDREWLRELAKLLERAAEYFQHRGTPSLVHHSKFLKIHTEAEIKRLDLKLEGKPPA